jgi:hypothetical protein
MTMKVKAKDIKKVAAKVGAMTKVGLTRKNWLRRWCALYKAKLYYYENSRVSHMKEVI